jgi:hypothetical protein
VGSTANCALPMTVLNTIVADTLNKFSAEVDALIEKGDKKEIAIMQVIQKYIVSSKKILFEGDGYSEAWHKEAEKRGLPNLKTTPVALDAMVTEKAKKVFLENGIYTHSELEARHEIELEKYIKKVQIEARVMGDLATNHIISDIFSILRNEENEEDFSLIIGSVKYSNGRLIKSQFSSRLKNKNMIHHQGAFYKRDLFRDFKYNPNYKISSDYELNLRLFLQKARYLQIDKVVTICGATGLSSVASWSGYSEEIKIRNQYLSKQESIIYGLPTILRFLIKKTLVTVLPKLRQN